VAWKVLVVTPIGKAAPLIKPFVWVTVDPQLSMVVTLYITTAAQELLFMPTAMFAGQAMVGAWVSVTLTVKLQKAELPEASVTWKVFVVIPTGNALLLGWPAVWVTVDAQLSLPVTVYITTALQRFGSLFTAMFAGQTMVGIWLSVTVTVKPQVAVLPAASVALNTLVVMPTGKVLPLGRPAVWVTVAAQLSVLLTVYITIAAQVFAPVLTAMFVRQLMVGNSLSNTVTVKLQAAELFDKSVDW
jgi:hypothetical protein